MDRLLAEGTLTFTSEHFRIGPAPDEIVLLYTVAFGTFEGPRLHLAAVPNTGAEWNSVRGDGVISLESRQLLRSSAGDLFYVTLSGVYDVGDDGYVDALDDVLKSSARADLAIRFYTAARNYRWLNRAQFVGLGQRNFTKRTLTLQIFCGHDLRDSDIEEIYFDEGDRAYRFPTQRKPFSP
jgi:Protein of unknown function (DUF3237)